jgi:3-isopropylmalate/(R)-2-methylmalate dehydratase large subunit
MSKPQTFFEKMWNDHVIADLGDGAALLQIDRLFLHELSGSGAIGRLERSGRPINSRGQVFGVVDHLISSKPGRGPDDTASRGGVELIRSMRRLANKHGITFFDSLDPRQGIVHVVSPELGIALPGTTLVCGDSHTCTVGGIGALAWGIGSTECEHVLATQTLTQIKPKTMRIKFEGELFPGVYPKDMILYLIGKIGANAGIGYVAEFAGSAIRKMPVEGRLTVCNMAIEFQAKYGFVPADDVTFDYVFGREFAPKGRAWDEAVSYWRTLASDEGAVFDKDITIDCTDIQPQVTWGTSPQHVAGIGDRVPDPADAADPGVRMMLERALEYIQLKPGEPLEGVKIDAAYIGSCTNARISDLREAAAVLRGRKVAQGVKAICVPGSSSVKRAAEAEGLDRSFREAGFEWHESGCAMCASQGGDRFADRRVISTTNRNFEGRQGPKTRTHLASPVTVAASAIAGSICDVRRVL